MLFAPDIPPGVYRNGTEYQSQGRWHDADLMRWHAGTMRPVGGWSELSVEPVDGMARAVLTWLDNAASAWIAVGTHEGLFALTRAGTVEDITPVGFDAGLADALIGGGFGSGAFGAGLFGTPRLDGANIIPASVWTLDTWGENLVGTMGGDIYEWELDPTVPAAVISGAPTAESVMVTEERIMMALGSDGDPRAVDWSDAENNTDWTPSATNLAGGKRLQTSGSLRLGKRVRGGYLLFTDVDVHLMRYEGLPLVYSFERLATGCGAASKGAAAVIDDKALWMGANAFWIYSGAVDGLPCDVQDYVFSDINRTQISKVSCWHNALWSEVWWHYPSAGSDEIDRYVSFNYREGHWSVGELDRLCGIDQGVLENPILVSSTGDVYRHEIGHMKDGRQPIATSGGVELGSGDRTMEVHAYIPDEATLGSVAVSFGLEDYPMSGVSTVASVPASAKTDLRFSARKVAVTIEGDADVDFRVGRMRFDVKPGSGR